MNDWRSNQVLIGIIWFCFVLLCCHPIIRMTWEASWRSSQGSICCHCMSSSISDISWCPMTWMSVQRFGFLPLLPLCFFFYFFLSFSEERGRYYPNGLRFDLLFYLFPGYKLPYFITPIYSGHYSERSISGRSLVIVLKSSSWNSLLLLTMAGGLSGTVGLFQLMKGLSRSGSWLVDAWAWFDLEFAWACSSLTLPKCELCDVRDKDWWPMDCGTFGVGGDKCCPDKWCADGGCPPPRAEWWVAPKAPKPASPLWPISKGLNKYLIYYLKSELCGQSVFWIVHKVLMICLESTTIPWTGCMWLWGQPGRGQSGWYMMRLWMVNQWCSTLIYGFQLWQMLQISLPVSLPTLTMSHM